MDIKTDKDILYVDTDILKKSHLQTLEFFLHTQRIKHREYPCSLFTRASFTVEAAFCGTVFFLALFSLLYLFQILTSYETDFRSLDTAVKEYECFGTKLSTGKEWIEGTWIRWDEENHLCFLGKTHGIPFLGANVFSVSTYQQLCFCTYDGKSMIPEEENTGEYVYLAEHGTVYHRSSSCVYLNPKISQISSKELENQRNRSGAKYAPCRRCSRGKQAGNYVYITPFGDSWHTKKNCSGLKRSIRKVPLSDVGHMAECSKCGGK